MAVWRGFFSRVVALYLSAARRNSLGAACPDGAGAGGDLVDLGKNDGMISVMPASPSEYLEGLARLAPCHSQQLR